MSNEKSPEASANPNQKENLLKKYWWVGLIILIIILLGVIIFLLLRPNMVPLTQNNQTKDTSSQNNNISNQNISANGDLGDANSTDPIEKGKSLSGGNCSGTGSKVLGSAPMHPSDLSTIVPYGLVIGGHVTPIDHEYYWGKIPMGDPDMYDVLAPADGTIVQIGYRDRSQENSKVKGDYRVVIMYSCTFFSYFDLATSLDSSITSQLPSGWESNGGVNANIKITQGQVVAKVGGQSLDFAVWDTTKYLEHLLVPTAYNNAEPWKIVTVPPLDYFSDEVKSEILPYYVRKDEPLDGRIDYDIDGYASGNWFLQGTNGYLGVFDYSDRPQGSGYWYGHLAIVPNHLDTNAWIFSIGDVNGQPQQYLIKDPEVAPDELSVDYGPVKYELAQISYIDGNGQTWTGNTLPDSISVKPSATKGTVLVQMTAKRELKIELFLGKSASEVQDFTSAARVYDRGDNAKMVESNTRTN